MKKHQAVGQGVNGERLWLSRSKVGRRSLAGSCPVGPCYRYEHLGSEHSTRNVGTEH